MCMCACLLLGQVIVHEVPGQELEVEVFDKDHDQDDFLGRYFSLYPCVITLRAMLLTVWAATQLQAK